MNAHSLRSMLFLKNVVPFTFFFLLIVIGVFGLTQSSATAGGGGGQRPPFPSDEDLKKDFDDADLEVKDDKPAGKAGYATLLDSKMGDPSVPAYVRSIQLLSGGGKYRGIHKIKRVEVTNRTSRTIVSVQVRVEVVNLDEPEKVLLEDEFPFADASITPDASQVVEIKTLYPPKLLKALARGGELNGRFGIRMGVQAVRFADGSFWRRPALAALLSSPNIGLSPSLRFPDLASLTALIPPPLRSTDTRRVDTPRCTGEPRLNASAFSSVRFEYDTCSPNTGPFVDLSTGRKSCSSPATSTCYAHCSDDDWCSTWQSPFPCSGPSATPQTGTCRWPPPDPCCSPKMVRPDPNLSIEYCVWDCESDCSPGTVFDDGCVKVNGPTSCAEFNEDYVYDAQKYGGACCPPAPTPTPPPENGTPCAINCRAEMGPLYECNQTTGLCEPHSPILVDVAGDGFSLTDAASGVDFRMTAGGAPVRVAWTRAGSDDSWLALDRDGDGRVGGAHELFGNHTPQPPAAERHGFLALAVFDGVAQGGNGDGRIDARDAAFTSLRLWRDLNHDGVSQPAELHTLPALDVARIHLDFKESKRVDASGNQFRYRAKVDDARGAKVGRWAWDVFLLSGR